MKLESLDPRPHRVERFARSSDKFIPNVAGCYALSTFDGTILYVGLATNLRRRFAQHLDSPAKTQETRLGRAVKFHWIETDDINRVERTWLNIHVHHEGQYPVLNKVFSPT